jgi:hypothetical protein
MHYFLIQGNASVRRKTTVAKKSTDATVLFHQQRGELVDLLCGSSRYDESCNFLQNNRRRLTSISH